MYQIEINDGFDILEELQKIPNKKIFERVLVIMQEYIELEEDSNVCK